MQRDDGGKRPAAFGHEPLAGDRDRLAVGAGGAAVEDHVPRRWRAGGRRRRVAGRRRRRRRGAGRGRWGRACGGRCEQTAEGGGRAAHHVRDRAARARTAAGASSSHGSSARQAASLVASGKRVRRRRRRQRDGRVAGGLPGRRRARRRLAVEGDGDERRRGAADARHVAALGVADRAVQAAAPLAGDDRVPQADPSRQQPREPLGVRQPGQRLPQQRTDDRPEVVARVRVVGLRRQRRLAGKAAQDQHPRVRSEHRRQSVSSRRCLRRRRQPAAVVARVSGRGHAVAPLDSGAHGDALPR